VNVPKNLDEAIEYLSVWLGKNSVYGLTENEFACQYHFGLAMQLRNEWGLWSGESELFKYFQSFGVWHPDDMTSIIFVSFYRDVMGRDRDLVGQTKQFQKYWEEARKTSNQTPIKKLNIFQILWDKIRGV